MFRRLIVRGQLSVLSWNGGAAVRLDGEASSVTEVFNRLRLVAYSCFTFLPSRCSTFADNIVAFTPRAVLLFFSLKALNLCIDGNRAFPSSLLWRANLLPRRGFCHGVKLLNMHALLLFKSPFLFDSTSDYPLSETMTYLSSRVDIYYIFPLKILSSRSLRSSNKLGTKTDD